MNAAKFRILIELFQTIKSSIIILHVKKYFTWFYYLKREHFVNNNPFETDDVSCLGNLKTK